MCVADWSVATRMNISKSDLLTPALTVSVADNANLELMGAQFMTITAAMGQKMEQLVYFAKGVGEFYLSKAALIDLEVISKNFPTVCDHKSNSVVGNINEVNDGFLSVRVMDNPCSQHDVLNLPPQCPGVRPPLAPCSLSPPVQYAPCIPQGMTSLGSTSHRVATMGQSEHQHSVTAMSNSS